MGSFTSFIKSFFVTPVEDYIIKPRQRHNVFQRNESDTTKNLRNLFDELAQVSPAFSVDAKNIEVLNTPQEYFENLINGIKNAKQRIILTSLYLGTGEHEKKIIEALETQLKSNPNITVHVLFDCLRGTRGTKEQKSSVTMLLPLVKKYGNRVSAFFYHTPKFNKFLKKIIPERVNEVVGVQHIKAYIFDDSMMMSGANLSDWYFVDRQDRYMMIRKEKEVVNYFVDLVSAVMGFSYLLTPDGGLKPLAHDDKGNPLDPVENPKEFIHFSRNKIMKLLHPHNQSVDKNADTWVFPCVQMGQLNIRHDEMITKHLFKTFPAESKLCLSSAYFNFTKKYIDLILKSPAYVDIITASPKANGFYTATGFSKHIPTLYSYVEQQFFNKICSHKRDHLISIYEYNRPGWTFHAKGLWMYYPKQSLPSVIMIGSPNFGWRSVEKDVEAQLVILTENQTLRKQFHEEYSRICKTSEKVTNDTFKAKERRVGFWLSIVANLFKKFL